MRDTLIIIVIYIVLLIALVLGAPAIEEYDSKPVKVSDSNLDSASVVDAVNDLTTANDLFNDYDMMAKFFISSYKVKHNGNWKVLYKEKVATLAEMEPVSETKMSYILLTVTNPATRADTAKVTTFYIFTCDVFLI